ncbi:MAG: hypothetical protein NVSMB26_19910 [Beijerinckiaceae bacterium]
MDGRPRRVVYTCLFGHSEFFNDYKLEDSDIDYICFTDDNDLRPLNWQVRLFENKLLDSARLSKSFKHLPHYYLPEYDQSLYIDNKVCLRTPPAEIFSMLEDEQYPLILLKHSWRDCIYDEAEAVITLEFDDPARVRAQMEFYRRLGYPPHHGLSTTLFLLREHGSLPLQKVNEEWHKQILCHSKRDQLSWNVCAWMHDFKFRSLEIDMEDNGLFRAPVVPMDVRLPRDFDDVAYLRFHPDVAESGMNPRLHFLRHGALEGRRYK